MQQDAKSSAAITKLATTSITCCSYRSSRAASSDRLEMKHTRLIAIIAQSLRRGRTSLQNQLWTVARGQQPDSLSRHGRPSSSPSPPACSMSDLPAGLLVEIGTPLRPRHPTQYYDHDGGEITRPAQASPNAATPRASAVR